MNEHQQRELAAGLRALADRTRDARASSRVEAAVMAGFKRKSESARLLPLAAGLILAIAGALWAVQQARVPSFVEPAGFVALPGAERLPLLESANIVRVSLPVAALPAYGVAVADQKAESVEAELLVAQDGQARAIRLVNVSTDRSANDD